MNMDSLYLVSAVPLRFSQFVHGFPLFHSVVACWLHIGMLQSCFFASDTDSDTWGSVLFKAPREDILMRNVFYLSNSLWSLFF